MIERGIFNQGPFYTKPGFVRGAIIFILGGVFIYNFWLEITQVIQLVWQPALTIRDDYLQSLFTLLWIGFVFLVSLFLILLLVSQFILPVQTIQQRRKVFDRLIAYLTRQHGPAVFIKGGKEIAKKSELLSSKPGVAFVDLTSAIALEKQSPKKIKSTSQINNTSGHSNSSEIFTAHNIQQPKYRGRNTTAVRIAGPGVVFTEPGETIRGLIDLRPQIRTRRDVHAYTREGIEIQTSITTMFTIGQMSEIIKVVYQGDEEPENLRIVLLAEKPVHFDGETAAVGELIIKKLIDGLDFADKQEIHRYIIDYRKTGGQVKYQTSIPNVETSAPFLFDPARIFKAIYASSLDIRQDDFKDWTELPPYIATEIFRNLIAGETYDYLYFPADQNKFPLQDLKSNFALKMRHQGVLAFQFFERKDSTPYKVGQEWVESRFVKYPIQELHNPKVLRARGIKVIHASFSDLTPVNPGVREQLLDNWSAYWDNEAEYTRVEHELIRSRIINNARIQAQINLKDQLLSLLGSSSVADEALALRLLQALEAVAADPKTQKFLPAETISMLRSIWEWLWTEDKPAKLDSAIEVDGQTMASVEVIEPGNENEEEVYLGDSHKDESFEPDHDDINFEENNE